MEKKTVLEKLDIGGTGWKCQICEKIYYDISPPIDYYYTPHNRDNFFYFSDVTKMRMHQNHKKTVYKICGDCEFDKNFKINLLHKLVLPRIKRSVRARFKDLLDDIQYKINILRFSLREYRDNQVQSSNILRNPYLRVDLKEEYNKELKKNKLIEKKTIKKLIELNSLMRDSGNDYELDFDYV